MIEFLYPDEYELLQKSDAVHFYQSCNALSWIIELSLISEFDSKGNALEYNFILNVAKTFIQGDSASFTFRNLC